MFLEVIFLVCFVAYAVVAFLVTRYLIKRQKHFVVKVLIGTLSAAIFYLILFGDSLVGTWYLNHLCETEGGTHIYRIVELGPEYWREDGSPKFINKTGTPLERGNFNSKIFDNKYQQKMNDYIQNESLGISIWTVSIVDTSNSEVLGEHKLFRYRGGWVANSMTTMAGDSCKVKQDRYQNLYKKIFVLKIGSK